jgi:hypothetical protein
VYCQLRLRDCYKAAVRRSDESVLFNTSTRRGSEMELGVVATARVMGKKRGFKLLTCNGRGLTKRQLGVEARWQG